MTLCIDSKKYLTNLLSFLLNSPLNSLLNSLFSSYLSAQSKSALPFQIERFDKVT